VQQGPRVAHITIERGQDTESGALQVDFAPDLGPSTKRGSRYIRLQRQGFI
jgi:hypothetical protein